jgi:hypothetical protein
MSMVLTKAGEYRLLVNMWNYGAARSSLSYALFTNAGVTFGDDTVAGNLTECTGGGYARKTVNYTSWGTPVSGNPSTIKSADIVWTFTGVPSVATVYGYYVFHSSSGDFLGGEVFSDGPYTIVAANDKITITPYIRIKDQGDIDGTSPFELLNVSEIRLMTNAVSNTVPDSMLTVEFFTNNFTPTDASVSGDFTICSDTAFIAQFNTSQFSVTQGTDGANGLWTPIDATSTTFTGTVYGYRISGQTSGTILGAERFSTPIVISAIGEKIKVTPALNLKTSAY